MCGICGRAHLLTGRAVSPESLERMLLHLHARGPDGEGTWISGSVGLGHRRLAVVELSERAAQPVGILDEQIVGVFNGELYNALALRERLRQQGVTLNHRGEMELILWAYVIYDEAFFEHLDGMFALAIWDNRHRRLLLARDRFGKKPLFYRLDHDGIAFGSLLASLNDVAVSPLMFDPIAIDQFLSLNYIPSPATGFLETRKLAAGECLTFDAAGVKVRPWVAPSAHSGGAWRLADAERVLLDRLDRAVEKRLRSDVPVGLFLSSGLDSAAVLASLHQLGASDIPAFTAAFKESGYDESEVASRLATHFRFPHVPIVVSPPPLETILQQLVHSCGEPVGDSSLLPTWLLAQSASERVTVVLNGDGGDECFGGYHRHLASHWVERSGVWGLPLAGLFGWAAHLVGQTGMDSGSTCGRWLSRLERLLLNLEMPLDDQYIRWMLLSNAKDSLYLRGERLRGQGSSDGGREFLKECLRQCCSRGWLERLLEVEWKTYLGEDLLVKMDRACMA
ncbi:MAG TPA: asparagine synthase (glutamine-hydrolyzing), partial [Candidatus Ozemobacteraceae bacterium]|nr:asparagine synthase (glutamine-hydrolyzing) [Candidatus Ozemobacteraceae bacterium]